MKTLITALLVLLVAGCMRRSDEPIRISVLGADRYELRNRMLDGRALQDDLRAHARRFGPSAPVVFSFPKGSTYQNAERPILIVSANGFWNMALSEQGTEEASRFFRHPGDGPPMIDVFLDVSGTNVLRDGIPCDLANDIDLRDR